MIQFRKVIPNTRVILLAELFHVYADLAQILSHIVSVIIIFTVLRYFYLMYIDEVKYKVMPRPI